MTRFPGFPHSCAERPGSLGPADRVLDLLVEVEVVAGGDGHPIVGESFELALPPGDVARAASNSC